MSFNFKTFSISLICSTVLFGCASQFELSEESKSAPLKPEAKSAMQAARGTTYVREIREDDRSLARTTTLSRQAAPLRTILHEILPDYTIIPGGTVDLNTQVDVSTRNTTVSDFIEYLEGVADIDIRLEGRKVYVTDFETREWNLSAFASTRSVNNVVASTQTAGAQAGSDSSGSSGQSNSATQGTSATVGYSLTEDEWLRILDGGAKILGAEEDDDEDSNALVRPNAVPAPQDAGLNFDDADLRAADFSVPLTEMEPYIQGIRSVGIVTAGGRPSKMRILDRYFRTAITESTKIVNVQVQAYDVILNDSKDKAIDWDALVKGTINGNPFGLVLDSVQRATTGNDPFWQITGNYESDHLTVNKMLISFLRQFGRVELNDQPNLTVRNGVPAQIYAGQELTYIVDVEQSQDINGNTTVTPRLGRLKVGVTLSVTVRVLEDERLLVDIWPVISNLGASDSISIGDYEFQTPRVNLKEFSTQLITSSGRSVHLGGLITKRLSSALATLPWEGLVSKAIAPAMEDVSNSIERRELVMVVTPTLIEGVL
ncbi:TPA: pilus assembly protein [Pseudomonas aeruginosa]|nr:pilus assembly protein [Pseudomonas aeruginosa]